MSATDFFAASRVLVVAGKGGVGKTTVGATIGVAAAAHGLDVLLVELEGRSNLAAPFAFEQLHYETLLLEESGGGGRLRARRLTPDEALRDYIEHSGLGPLSDRLAQSGSVEVVATAAPGIRDLLVLGKIRQMEEAGEADLIVVDAPAAGHAITFLRSAAGLATATSAGPVRQQADQVLALLGDEQRCRVVLVTVPEDAPVTELVETAYDLEDRAGVSLGPIVVNNRWMPVDGLDDALTATGPTDDTPLVAAARYRIDRVRAQQAEVDRLRRELPLPLLELPHLFTTRLDRGDLTTLADAMCSQLDAGVG
ncbi:MAG: ArsA-related P-loop ATPase [Actinomycetota bacterium]